MNKRIIISNKLQIGKINFENMTVYNKVNNSHHNRPNFLHPLSLHLPYNPFYKTQHMFDRSPSMFNVIHPQISGIKFRTRAILFD